jgi:hypothetical protein
MSFSDKQIELLQNLYNDASLGLTKQMVKQDIYHQKLMNF